MRVPRVRFTVGRLDALIRDHLVVLVPTSSPT